MLHWWLNNLWHCYGLSITHHTLAKDVLFLKKLLALFLRIVIKHLSMLGFVHDTGAA